MDRKESPMDITHMDGGIGLSSRGLGGLAVILAAMSTLVPHQAFSQTQPSPPSVSDTTLAPIAPEGQSFQLGRTTQGPLPDTLRTHRTIKSESFASSPTGALLRSVVFPGWGQWSNGKRQKAAVYFAIESYWITKALIWRDRAEDAEDFDDLEHARDRRNYFYWLTGITIFVSMFDAYADRYLLTLERTRDAPEGFWGDAGHAPAPGPWQLTLSIKF